MPARLNEICARPNHPLPGRTTGPLMARQLYVATPNAPFRKSRQYPCTPSLPILEGSSMVEQWTVERWTSNPPIFLPDIFLPLFNRVARINVYDRQCPTSTWGDAHKVKRNFSTKLNVRSSARTDDRPFDGVATLCSHTDRSISHEPAVPFRPESLGSGMKFDGRKMDGKKWTSHSTYFFPTSFYLSSPWIALQRLSTGYVQRTLQKSWFN